MDVDSDSDISLLGDEHRGKGKGKGKAIDKRKKDKGKAKAKDVSSTFVAYDVGHLHFNSNLTHGRHPTRVLGILCRKMRPEVCRAPWKISWRGAGARGSSIPLVSCVFIDLVNRLLAPAAAIRRTIIRHLVLLLDLSAAMMDRDLRPTRFDLMLQYAKEFVLEWFDQNPLGQIGVVGMRAGIGERIGEMSGRLFCRLGHQAEIHSTRQPAGCPQVSQ